MTATTTAPPVAHRDGAHHTDAGRATLREVWADTLVFARRNIEHIRQIPEKLLDVTVQPLMFVLLFSFVFGGAIAVGSGDASSYREYVIAGILIQSLTFGMGGPASAIATDMTEGVIDRFRSLPSARPAYLLGHYLAELAGILLSIAVLLGAGLIVGWRTHTPAWQVAEALALLVVFASATIWAGTWMGMQVRSPDAVMGVLFVAVFPLTFLSNAFVPVGSLPDGLQWVASVNPISVIVSAVRRLFGNPLPPVTKHVWTMDHPVVSAWLMSAVVLVVCVIGALRRYRQRTVD